MKKQLFILVIGIFLPVAIFAQTWKNDPAHSRMEFTISHNLISKLGGVFSDYSITAQGAETDFSDATIDVVVQTESVDTEEGKTTSGITVTRSILRSDYDGRTRLSDSGYWRRGKPNGKCRDAKTIMGVFVST